MFLAPRLGIIIPRLRPRPDTGAGALSFAVDFGQRHASRIRVSSRARGRAGEYTRSLNPLTAIDTRERRAAPRRCEARAKLRARPRIYNRANNVTRHSRENFHQ